MKNTDNGVRFYTPAKLEYEFGFPNDNCVCQWCPFCYPEATLQRHRCRVTGEYLVYPFTERGQKCPVKVTDAPKKYKEGEF